MINLLYFLLPLHMSPFPLKVLFLYGTSAPGHFPWLIHTSLLAWLWCSHESKISNFKLLPQIYPLYFWSLSLMLYVGKVMGLSFLTFIHFNPYLSLSSNTFLKFSWVIQSMPVSISSFHISEIYIFFKSLLLWFLSFFICSSLVDSPFIISDSLLAHFSPLFMPGLLPFISHLHKCTRQCSSRQKSCHKNCI